VRSKEKLCKECTWSWMVGNVTYKSGHAILHFYPDIWNFIFCTFWKPWIYKIVAPLSNNSLFSYYHLILYPWIWQFVWFQFIFWRVSTTCFSMEIFLPIPPTLSMSDYIFALDTAIQGRFHYAIRAS